MISLLINWQIIFSSGIERLGYGRLGFLLRGNGK
jgi:hypothetical protein